MAITYLTQDVKKEKKEISDWLNALKGIIKIFREIKVANEKEINFDKLGIWWADSMESAYSYLGGLQEKNILPIVLQAKVDMDDVNKPRTTLARFVMPEEKEICLYENANIFLEGYWVNGKFVSKNIECKA